MSEEDTSEKAGGDHDKMAETLESGDSTDKDISAQLADIKMKEKEKKAKAAHKIEGPQSAHVPPGWQDEDTYPVTESVGHAVIFSMQKFKSNTGKETRQGQYGSSKNDAEQLRLVLEEIGFQRDHVKVKKDYTVEKMKKHLQKVAGQDHSKNGCFLCIVLTHGEETEVVYQKDGSVTTTHTNPKARRLWGCDGAVTVDQLVEPFKGDKCNKTLAAKPKIFIIQADEDIKIPIKMLKARALIEKGPPSDLKLQPYLIPAEANILVLHSVIPSEWSWSWDGEKSDEYCFLASNTAQTTGKKETEKQSPQLSCFIHHLCSVLKRGSHGEDLQSLLTRVCGHVEKDVRAYLENAEQSFLFELCDLTPYISSSLLKDVHLKKTQ